MSKKRITSCALAMLAVPLFTQTASAARPAVVDVVRKMQAFYEQTKDLKGKFKQVYTATLYDRRRTHWGYFYVRKPGMMRWNYAKPERKAFISDGKVFWIWEPADKQVFKNPLDAKMMSSGSGLSFLFGRGDLLKEFKIAYVADNKDMLGGPQHLVLKLTPRVATAQYKYLVLAVRPADHAVEESMIVKKHERNHFTFYNLKTNTKLSTRRFRFTPPAGTRVIDRSSKKLTNR